MRNLVVLTLVVLLAPLGWGATLGNSVAVDLVRGKPLARVYLNGQGPYPFVVDFAAPRPVVTAEAADYVKLAQSSAPFFEGRAVPVTASSFTCGQLTVFDVTMLRMDLKPFERQLGVAVAGVFGGREFAPEVELDIPGGVLHFYTAEEAAVRAAGRTQAVRFDVTAQGAPVIPVVVDREHMVQAVVDTAFGGSLCISERQLQTWGLPESAPRLTLQGGGGAFAPEGKFQVRLASLRAGAVEMRAPVATVVEGDGPARIGAGFFRHCAVSIDNDAGTVTVSTSEPEPLVEPAICGAGVVPGAYEGTGWTLWVAKESPAGRAGVQPGALLTSVNGKAASGDYGAVAALLDVAEGENVLLSVRQEGHARDFALVAEKLL